MQITIQSRVFDRHVIMQKKLHGYKFRIETALAYVRNCPSTDVIRIDYRKMRT